MLDCQRCSSSEEVSRVKIAGFSARICMACLNEWSELYYSEALEKEKLDFAVLSDYVEISTRCKIMVGEYDLTRLNEQKNKLDKMAFFMAKKFMDGSTWVDV